MNYLTRRLVTFPLVMLGVSVISMRTKTNRLEELFVTMTSDGSH